MLSSLISKTADILWGPPTLLLILCTGVYLSSISGFFQLTHLTCWLRTLFPNQKHTLKSLFTALGGSIGIGSIAGVASALSVGGPGSIFWMWISALLGMMIKFSEIALAVKYREKTSFGFRGGPMFYIHKALRCRLLSILFCLFTIFASFGIGSMCQSNALASSMRYMTGISPKYIAIPLLVIYSFFLFQNASYISNFASIAVPAAAICYLLFGCFLLFSHRALLPSLLHIIIKDAFSGSSICGGIIGLFSAKCVRIGIARGIFSNEAGLGSAPIIHAETPNTTPYHEGLLGIAESGISTLLICTVSGFLFLLAQIEQGIPFDSYQDSTVLALRAFSSLTSPLGTGLLGFSICLFAFMAPLGWSLCGRRATEYLFPEKKSFLTVYLILFLFSLFLGFFLHVEIIWQLSDIFNALMTLPNLLSITALHKEIREILYSKNREQGVASD